MSEGPSLFDLDYKAVIPVLESAARKLEGTDKGLLPWQYREGYTCYKYGKTMRSVMVVKNYNYTDRTLWRFGWLAAMFDDLNNRETIIMKRKEDPGCSVG